MNHPNLEGRRFVSIADCEICGKLAERETSFFKYAHEDETRLLPPEASRLVRVPDVEPAVRRREEIKRCPVCGIFYYYLVTYEYLVDGSEDEEILTRLTPTEARRFYTDDEYDRLITSLAGELPSSHRLARRYAAKCLVAHHFARQNLAAVEHYLRHPDAETARGGFWYLHSLMDDSAQRPRLEQLMPTFESLSCHFDEEIASVAHSLEVCLNKIRAVQEKAQTKSSQP